MAYKREIAGYALKFIWRTAEPYADGLGHFDPEIISLYGNSESPVDRMIASELLLSYAIGTGEDPSDIVPKPCFNHDGNITNPTCSICSTS